MAQLLRALFAVSAAASAAAATPLQALIDTAIAEGASSLTLAPNTVFTQGSAPLVISASDFALDCAGATIVFAPGAGVVIEQSTRVEVSNATVRYEPPCFSQGAVTAVDTAAHTVDVRLDAGFAAPDAPFFTTVEIKLQFFDGNSPTRARPPQSGSCIVDIIGETSPGVWRVRSAQGFACVIPPLPGLQATLSPRVNAPGFQIPGGYVGGAFWNFNSTRVTARDVTLLGSGNFAFTEWGGGGGHVYDGIVLDRDASVRALLSSNTDGFHSFATEVGPTITRSRLSWMGDDVANFHNRVGLVLAVTQSSASSLTLSVIDVGDTPTPRLDPDNPSRAFSFATRGDVFKLSSPGGVPRGVAPGGAFTISAIKWDTTPATVAAARAAVAARPGVAVDPRGIGVWTVSFAASASGGSGIVEGDIVQFDRMSGAGAIVADSFFSDAYDSCFRLQSSHTRLSNNTWARVPGGINVGFDADWLEGASDIADIAINDNTFRAIKVPPAKTIDEILSVQKTVVNLTQARNTVLPA